MTTTTGTQTIWCTPAYAERWLAGAYITDAATVDCVVVQAFTGRRIEREAVDLTAVMRTVEEILTEAWYS